MPEPEGEHYFSADPSVPFARETFTCEVWGRELTLVSGAGVFSRGTSTTRPRSCSARPSRRCRAGSSTSAAGTA